MVYQNSKLPNVALNTDMNRLVVNGCSYMNTYAIGNGHIDLAHKLDINTAIDLSQSGCANGRILRTTLKDSYLNEPSLYVLGMTFISRSEAPILNLQDKENEETSFEGRWTNPQNQIFENRWMDHWRQKDTDDFVNLKLKEEAFSLIDRTEDLMIRMCALIDSLRSRRHRVIIFQQADDSYHHFLSTPKLSLFKKYGEFVDSFGWCSIHWQHKQGVQPIKNHPISKYGKTPDEMVHREPGEHELLNEYLVGHYRNII